MKLPVVCYANITRLDPQPDVLPLLNDAPANASVNLTEDVNITRTDWQYGKDFSRPWVQYFLPYLKQHLHQHLKPFDDFLIADIWFQQYDNQSQHGWHTHSHNFTGVYYVQLPPNVQTELIQPYSNKIISLPVQQGDIVYFPSTVIHRAPPASNKTIISFNFDAFYHYRNVV